MFPRTFCSYNSLSLCAVFGTGNPDSHAFKHRQSYILTYLAVGANNKRMNRMSFISVHLFLHISPPKQLRTFRNYVQGGLYYFFKKHRDLNQWRCVLKKIGYLRVSFFPLHIVYETPNCIASHIAAIFMDCFHHFAHVTLNTQSLQVEECTDTIHKVKRYSSEGYFLEYNFVSYNIY